MVLEVVVEAGMVVEVVVEEGFPHLDLGEKYKKCKRSWKTLGHNLCFVCFTVFSHLSLGILVLWNPMEKNNLKAEQLAEK